MGRTPLKKTPSKKGKSPAQERRSASRSMQSESVTSSPESETVQTPRLATYSHRLPTQEQRRGNGRHHGRSLIKWNRPKMAEKLLLHLVYECSRHKISLPWDAIAHRLHPGSSGAAVLQHFNRMRKELLSEGHLVPPTGTKPGTGPVDVEIRGYVRTEEGDVNDVRAVKFNENVEDPKISLPCDFEDEVESMEECGRVNSDHSPPDAVPSTPRFSGDHKRHGLFGTKLEEPDASFEAMTPYRHPQMRTYPEDFFASGSFSHGSVNEDPFQEASAAQARTPVREPRYFMPMTPDRTPFGNTSPEMYGYSSQSYMYSPVRFPQHPSRGGRDVSSSHSSEVPPFDVHQTQAPDFARSGGAPSIEHGEPEKQATAKVLLDDMMISGRHEGIVEDGYEESAI